MNQEKIKKVEKAVFLDRDGVINKDIGYLYKIQDFEWIPGAIDAIKLLKSKNFLIIIISNQSGVERGFFEKKDVENLHSWISNELNKQNTSIDDFFFSTELPSKKLTRRKPSPQMVEEAVIKYNLNKNYCFMVGDKPSDVECAKNADIKGYLFNEENLLLKIKEILKDLNFC